jgi:hypothetical protein
MEISNNSSTSNVSSGDTLFSRPEGLHLNVEQQFKYDHKHYDQGTSDDTAPFDVAAFLNYLAAHDAGSE